MGKNKVKIAFLGGMYPDDVTQLQSNAKASLDYAADAYQKKYLKPLAETGEITVFSRLFVGAWPINYKKIYVSESGKSSFGDVKYINYFNPAILREFSQKRNTVKTVKKWYDLNKNDGKCMLFVYSAAFSKEIISLKKLCPDMKICIILPDLPIFTYLSDTSRLRKYIIAKRQAAFERSCNYADCCICITEAMKSFVEARADIKTFVIEAIADKERCEASLKRLNEKENGTNGKRVILYTGTLAKKYGILDLIKAFESISDNACELQICGGGDALPDIKRASEADLRIKYLGIVSNEQSKLLQDSADILVNPRSPEGEYTAYSFPSKTMEYLETGNTVVCHRLAGIPKEYAELVIHPEDADYAALARSLEAALELSREERLACGKRNLKFLLEKKCGNALFELLDLMGD